MSNQVMLEAWRRSNLLHHMKGDRHQKLLYDPATRVSATASVDQTMVTPSAPTTASDDSFLPVMNKYVWILNDGSVYIDSLATTWENDYEVLWAYRAKTGHCMIFNYRFL